MKASGAQSDNCYEDGGFEAPKATTVKNDDSYEDGDPIPVTVGMWLGGGGWIPIGEAGLGTHNAGPYGNMCMCVHSQFEVITLLPCKRYIRG